MAGEARGEVWRERVVRRPRIPLHRPCYREEMTYSKLNDMTDLENSWADVMAELPLWGRWRRRPRAERVWRPLAF